MTPVASGVSSVSGNYRPCPHCSGRYGPEVIGYCPSTLQEAAQWVTVPWNALCSWTLVRPTYTDRCNVPKSAQQGPFQIWSPGIGIVALDDIANRDNPFFYTLTCTNTTLNQGTQ